MSSIRFNRPRSILSVSGSAFTLIEVLAVVSIIALLVSTLIPSLTRAREQSSGAVCKSNMSQLMKGQLMYVSEWRKLPGTGEVFYFNRANTGLPGNNYIPLKSTWLGLPWPPGEFGGLQPWETLNPWAKSYAPHQGTLFKYMRNKEVYLCPKDQPGRPNSDDPKGGGGNGVFSYTMNGYLGFKSPEKARSFTYVADFKPAEGLDPPIPPLKPRPLAKVLKGQRFVWSESDMMTLFEEHPWNNTNWGYPMDSFI